MHNQHKHDFLTPTNEENQEGSAPGLPQEKEGGVSTWSPARMRPARSAEPRGTTCRSVSRSYSFERRLRELLARGEIPPTEPLLGLSISPKIMLTIAFPGTYRARFCHRPRTKRAQVSRQSWPLALPPRRQRPREKCTAFAEARSAPLEDCGCVVARCRTGTRAVPWMANTDSREWWMRKSFFP